jgi:hypothetical protein
LIVLVLLSAFLVAAVVVVQPDFPADAQIHQRPPDRLVVPDPHRIDLKPSPGEAPAGWSARRSARASSARTGGRPVSVRTADGEPAPLPGARPWRPISAAAFDRRVEAVGFDRVEYVTPHLVHGTFAGDGQQIHVLLVHRSATEGVRVSPGDRGRESVGAWADAIGAAAGINANWFDPVDGPAVSQGRAYGGVDHGYTALFGFGDDGRFVAQHHRVANEVIDPRIQEAVSGHPTLVYRGEVTTDFGRDPTFIGRHPRTAIGVTATTDVLIVVVIDGRRRDAVGMTGTETAGLMERLGAHDAVMLDGGGSSAMWIRGRGLVNRPSDPGRRVGNQIAIFG